MSTPNLDYDTLAPTYHNRYAVSPLPGVRQALEALAASLPARSVLEVGCGTGYWLSILEPLVARRVGLDLSRGMLLQARRLLSPAASSAPRQTSTVLETGEISDPHLSPTPQSPFPLLIQGRSGRLPFPAASFDLIFCVNALHHFESAEGFLEEAWRLLRPGGTLAIVGLTPHGRAGDWYVYRYFSGTYETDIQRFPTWGRLADALVALGAARLSWGEVERIHRVYTGREVLADPFLARESTSQLALLSPLAYAAGRARMEAAIAAAESEGRVVTFPNHLRLDMLTAVRPS